jgi:MOSC domain-containing protein YiiM
MTDFASPEAKPAKLLSVQVGLPATHGVEDAEDPHDQPWFTGIYKHSVAGRVYATANGLRGDGQADLQVHGGADKAVLAYSADHYAGWRRELDLPAMPYGAFGENLTIANSSEESVCIGDILRIGAVKFEVSQPRQPCWKLARRWRMHELVAMVVHSGRSGWYLRVIEEGYIEASMAVELLERPNPEWTIARANSVMNFHPHDLALAVGLAKVPRLSASWVNGMRERVDRIRAHAAQHRA